jgi:murein DD-endopeptidase MepM/ murein hydrolase activator NlpD
MRTSLNRELCLLSACLFAASAGCESALPSPERAPVVQPAAQVHAEVMTAPEPATIAGRRVLAYEIVIANPTSRPIALVSVTYRAGAFGETTLQGKALRDRTQLLFEGDASSGEDLRTLFKGQELEAVDGKIPAGRSGAVFLWLTAPTGAEAPARIDNELVIQTAEGSEHLHMEARPVTRAPLVLGAPVRGDRWITANGFGEAEGHVRTLIPAGGRQWLSQRFAADFERVDADGHLLRTGAAKTDSTAYADYGADIVAVADARVARVIDGLPENRGEQRAIPITAETVTGNAVFLDLGDSRYAFYAHVQPGSIRVKEGDHVVRGQVLARLGHSGNSTRPHLHFHVCSRPSGLACDGLPYVLDRFTTAPLALPTKVDVGDTIQATAASRVVERELPAPGSMLTFAAEPSR